MRITETVRQCGMKNPNGPNNRHRVFSTLRVSSLALRTRFLWAAGALILGLQWNAHALETPHGRDVFSATTPMVVVPPKTVIIAWDYPVNRETPDLVFNLYSTSHLKLPVRQWPLQTNIPGSVRSVQIMVENPRHFFVLTASNSMGESPYATR